LVFYTPSFNVAQILIPWLPVAVFQKSSSLGVKHFSTLGEFEMALRGGVYDTMASPEKKARLSKDPQTVNRNPTLKVNRKGENPD
jgi:hypothetical protein